MSLFLTPEQVQELTGLRQRGKQIKWLQKNGIIHYGRANGWPMVFA